MNNEIGKMQKDIAEWADTLIPNRTAKQAMIKLVMEEIPELLRNPEDAGEFADVVILVLDIAHLQGIDIEKAVIEKMEKNKARKWVTDTETGIMHHI